MTMKKLAPGEVFDPGVLSLFRHLLYGVDANRVKLDGLEFEVIEDEEDGYRSSMDAVAVLEPGTVKGAHGVLDEVILTYSEDRRDEYSDGPRKTWKLISTTSDHVWLEFGTDYADTYYPYFVFDFYPMKEAV